MKKLFVFGCAGLVLNINSIFGQYAWYISLLSTTVGTNLAIYQTQAAFAYIGSIFIFKSKITVDKILGVLLSFAGVIIIALYTSNNSNSSDSDSDSDSTGATNSLGGIIAVIISTLLFACSEIAVKYLSMKIFNQNRLIQDTLLLQFFMGFTALLFAVGKKDMMENPRFKVGLKKNGEPSYFQYYDKNKDNLQHTLDSVERASNQNASLKKEYDITMSTNADQFTMTPEELAYNMS